MHDGMPYDRNQGQGQGHSREVDRQSPTGLIFLSVCCAVNYSPFFALLFCVSCVLCLLVIRPVGEKKSRIASLKKIT